MFLSAVIGGAYHASMIRREEDAPRSVAEFGDESRTFTENYGRLLEVDQLKDAPLPVLLLYILGDETTIRRSRTVYGGTAVYSTPNAGRRRHAVEKLPQEETDNNASHNEP